MTNIVDSVSRAVQDCQDIETSSFFKNYQEFSKEYNSLIQGGITRPRESQLKTLEQGNVVPFSYNIAK
ncbi:hypothetical protein AGMMS50293_23380 [Spirochaetia bacterium]|nr:hypothetical protein AGMMS50293_23380 [Spirochaetia bacterium]